MFYVIRYVNVQKSCAIHSYLVQFRSPVIYVQVVCMYYVCTIRLHIIAVTNENNKKGLIIKLVEYGEAIQKVINSDASR